MVEQAAAGRPNSIRVSGSVPEQRRYGDGQIEGRLPISSLARENREYSGPDRRFSQNRFDRWAAGDLQHRTVPITRARARGASVQTAPCRSSCIVEPEITVHRPASDTPHRCTALCREQTLFRESTGHCPLPGWFFAPITGHRSTGLFRFQNRGLEKKPEMLYNNMCKYKEMRMAVLNSEQGRPTGRIFADERC